jgi:hypothetical protein
MRKATLFMAGGAVVLLGWLAAGQAQEQDSSPERGGSILYLRPPEGRLARLDGLLHLTETQKTNVLRALERADHSARAAVEKGDAEVRASLDEERRKQFDELRSDTEVAPAPMTAAHAFQKLPSFAEQEASQKKGKGGKRKRIGSGKNGANSGPAPMGNINQPSQ